MPRLWEIPAGGGGTPDDDSVTGAKISPDAVFGASSKKLTNFVPYSGTATLLRVNTFRYSNFIAKINGAPTATSVVFDTLTGEADSLDVNATTELGKIILYNTTRGNSRKVTACNTGTSTITTESSVDNWADNDNITAESSTCVVAYTPKMFDIDLSGFLPATANAIYLQCFPYDTTTPMTEGIGIRIHPWEALANSATVTSLIQVGALSIYTYVIVPVISQKICVNGWYCAAGSGRTIIQCLGWFEEAHV